MNKNWILETNWLNCVVWWHRDPNDGFENSLSWTLKDGQHIWSNKILIFWICLYFSVNQYNKKTARWASLHQWSVSSTMHRNNFTLYSKLIKVKTILKWDFLLLSIIKNIYNISYNKMRHRKRLCCREKRKCDVFLP